MSTWQETLVVDATVCDGHGVCSELFPEHISVDPWGFPIVDDEAITPALHEHAERAVASCPKHALHLVGRRC